ncbi:hypothetical protein BD324DRAFT_424910 [Kockovaella imperatae]|uniref:Zn(2)-C6 fungal-type domain-containing protein n=1 Tax=Kockovaella imperatae TaxID=4999 RepID=A0A1Y1UJ03_9TREE|nr:hypothetical protein BD324DRAFT_424910 [Kockovaella imperatae]ORX37085.1 hypothetical protein BD324DRAFT_424910 [Kockovaella imperatae]
MVYPPPPPLPGHSPTSRHSGTFASEKTTTPIPLDFVQPFEEHPRRGSGAVYWTPKTDKRDLGRTESAQSSQISNVGLKRRPSVVDEEIAGLALADLSAGLSIDEVKARRDNLAGAKSKKKPRKESNVKTENVAKKSCSECRRLKAKCDRVFPCSNCRRRGCALVCPDGDLSCMQGKRLVLASTEELHDRIAQLETALAHSHSQTADTTHPLLAPQFLDGGFVNATPPPDLESPKRNSLPLTARLPVSGEHSPLTRGSDASFTIQTPQPENDRGASQGRMAVQSLLSDDTAASEGKKELEWVGANAAPALMMGAEANHGLEDKAEHHRLVERLQKLLRILPPRVETRRRADHFFQNCQWYQTMLESEEFDRVYEPAVYEPTTANPLSPHKLACVLMVLTLDTYFDLTEEEDNPAVGRYWEGVQKCFDTRFGWAASVAGVQALALASMFVALGWRGAKASNFYWLRQMTSAVQQLGLHKDPHPSLPESERNFRRRVFHESFLIDCLMSINHGQRNGIALEGVETRMPENVSFMRTTKYNYMRLVKAAVIDIGCRSAENPASWEDIQRVASIIRQYDASCRGEFHCPLLRGEPLPPKSENPTHMDIRCLTSTTMSMCHYKAMLFLYRPSLRRLIERLRYKPSQDPTFFDERDKEVVSMTYAACRAIISCSRYLIRTHPLLSARFWSVWVQALSAAVSLAALAIWCGPHLEPTFIASAYLELTEAVNAVEESNSKRSRGVLALFPVIQTTVHQRYPQLIGKDSNTSTICQQNEDMLFALLGGHVIQQGVSPTQGPLMNPPFSERQRTPTAAVSHIPSQSQSQSESTELSSSNQSSTGYPSTTSYPPPYLNGESQMVVPFVGYQPLANPFEVYQQPPPMIYSLPPDQATHQAETTQAHPPMSTHSSSEMLEGMPLTQDIRGTSVAVDPSSGEDLAKLDVSELWARLQTFYEPSPAYWGQSVGTGDFRLGTAQQHPVASGN